MRITKQGASVNPTGSPKFTQDNKGGNFGRGDFLRDLKKVSKKQGRPSQSDR